MTDSTVKDAKRVVVTEILLNLRTGIDKNRRQAVREMVKKMEEGKLRIVDTRAKDHHGKVYIIDDQFAVITSSNLSNKGLHLAVEAGTVLGDADGLFDFIEDYSSRFDHLALFRHEIQELVQIWRKEQIKHIIQKFDEYFAKALDLTEAILKALNRWLKFARPWDVYLKTMLAFENLSKLRRIYKPPVNYQVDIIARTLRQIQEYSGAMVVASTGLGKTVIATHVALRLAEADEIKNVMIIGSKVMRGDWEKEMRSAGLACVYFVHQLLDKQSYDQDRNLESFEEITQRELGNSWLLIIDECHEFRRRYAEKVIDGEPQLVERRAFTRLIPLIKNSGCRVLLLTGSPFATDVSNINDQLLLLPHTNSAKAVSLEEIFETAKAWKINELEEFVDLKVSSLVTTPHVAKYYSQTDEHGLYVKFEEEKRYIPKVKLRRIDFPLLLEKEVTQALTHKCFRVKARRAYIKSLIETRLRIAWGSSPWALQNVIGKVLDTPGGPKSYAFEQINFLKPIDERRKILLPLYEKLKTLTYLDDKKFQLLCDLLKHCKGQNIKVIVFSEMRATVAYLSKYLSQQLPHLKLACTITGQEPDSYGMKSEREINKMIKEFAPIANKVAKKSINSYDVFISTDAHGVGINMQDAQFVVNYDIAWTPIDPIQRAGRILRPWPTARNIELIAFVPKLAKETPIARELNAVRQRWINLTDRHDKSKTIIELPTLPASAEDEVYMPDFAKKAVVQLDLNALSDTDISPYYKHTANLQANRNYAEAIPDDIISAKLYPGKHHLVYVLLKYREKYYWPVYNIKADKLEKLTDTALLGILACHQNDEPAYVPEDVIEEASNLCVQKWCQRNKAEVNEVVRDCALYLKPFSEKDSIHTLL